MSNPIVALDPELRLNTYSHPFEIANNVPNSFIYFQKEIMMLRYLALIFFALICAANAQTNRTELKRADLTGTNMEIVVSVVDVQPGNNLIRHTHHGEEAVYVLEGATLALPDGKEVPFPTGAATINIRDVPHGGFKVAGDKTLKMLTVHIVDKGKPMMEPVK